uniref:Uncharacterized protein n=1 Tax=Rhizophora mucronata TaxID=61149 RepID=A0A2P2KES3_RHIMU
MIWIHWRSHYPTLAVFCLLFLLHFKFYLQGRPLIEPTIPPPTVLISAVLEKPIGFFSIIIVLGFRLLLLCYSLRQLIFS